MNLRFNSGSIGFLCLAWAFFLLLGGTIAPTAPFILMVIGTALYLFM
jgi:hypothetical protein